MVDGMKLLDISSYSVTAQRTLAMAAAVARARFHDQVLVPEHIAYALSEQEAATARAALVSLGVDLFRLRSLLTAAIETDEERAAPSPNTGGGESFRAPSPPPSIIGRGAGGMGPPVSLPTGAEPLPLAPLTLAVLNQAQRLAGGGAVHTTHLLEALVTTPSMAGGILGRLGATVERLRPELARAAAQPDAAEPVETGITDLVAQARTGKLPPLLPRPRYTDAAARALLQQYGRGVLLVGEPGSGRWSLVLALAAAEASPHPPTPSLSRGEGGTAPTPNPSPASRDRGATDHAQSSYPGSPFPLGRGGGGVGLPIIALARDLLPDDPRATVQRAVDRAAASGAVLAVPEMQRFFAPGAPGFFKEAGAILRRAAQSRTRLIATTTPTGATLFEADETFRDLQRIDVEPASSDETLKMLELLRPELEARHQVTIAPSALPAAVDMATRYLPGVLPEKAIHLLDGACAQFLLNRARGSGERGAGSGEEVLRGSTPTQAAPVMGTTPSICGRRT